MRTSQAGSTLFKGFTNLAAREAASWWTTRRWRSNAAVWTAIHLGVLSAMLWVLPQLIAQSSSEAPAAGLEAVRQLPELMAVIVAIGAVLITQGTLIDEHRHGVIDWLLSKPLSRLALVAAKFVAHSGSIIVVAVVVPWIAMSTVMRVTVGAQWPLDRIVAVVGLLALVVTFHVALVLALSALTRSRIAVLAVPIAAVVGADVLVALAPWLFYVSPWSLGPLASVVLAEGVMLSPWPAVSAATLAIGLAGVAAAGLHRSEQ